MKKLLCVFLTILCVALFSFSALAKNDDRIVDNWDILTDNEEKQLEKLYRETSERLKFDLVIVTEKNVNDLESYADDFYDYGFYGLDDENSGLLLLVTDDGCWLSTTGSGIYYITDSVMSELSKSFHGNVDSVGYFYAFSEFANDCENAIISAFPDIEYGEEYPFTEWDFDTQEYYPSRYDTPKSSPDFLGIIVISLVIGLVTALIVTLVMKGKLKTVRSKRSAENYLVNGSFDLTRSKDIFLYRNVISTKRAEDTNNHNGMNGGSHSSLGGGSIHTGSSGTSHGGGRF